MGWFGKYLLVLSLFWNLFYDPDDGNNRGIESANVEYGKTLLVNNTVCKLLLVDSIRIIFVIFKIPSLFRL